MGILIRTSLYYLTAIIIVTVVARTLRKEPDNDTTKPKRDIGRVK